MSSDNYQILSRVFTRSVLKSFTTTKRADDIYDTAVKLFISRPEMNTIGENFELLYSILNSKYRNEYYYKNTLLNKLLLGVHSLNTTTALTELPIAESKADFVLINGKAVVYEIKTELDNLERLDGQISNYYKAFDHVCILSYESNAITLLQKYLETPVGVYVITRKGTIRRIKEPIRYDCDLNSETIFHVLRKYEYENVLLKFYGELPQVSQFDYYNTCLNLFTELGVDNTYSVVLNELKARNPIRSSLFNEIPVSLKSLCYFSDLTASQFDRLYSNLAQHF